MFKLKILLRLMSVRCFTADDSSFPLTIVIAVVASVVGVIIIVLVIICIVVACKWRSVID